ncbi:MULTISPECIES: hypothetical protein [unclassified Microcoleus]|uniref:hypothetical protein n=1 Tax=unclassified Microcoleus TaxID=2642155 RepID=UPI002FD050C9
MPAQPTAANIYRTTNFNVDRPVQYPVACSPQVWAIGSIFLTLENDVKFSPRFPQQPTANYRVRTTQID